jgi:hypothetical protein
VGAIVAAASASIATEDAAPRAWQLDAYGSSTEAVVLDPQATAEFNVAISAAALPGDLLTEERMITTFCSGVGRAPSRFVVELHSPLGREAVEPIDPGEVTEACFELDSSLCAADVACNVNIAVMVRSLDGPANLFVGLHVYQVGPSGMPAPSEATISIEYLGLRE